MSLSDAEVLEAVPPTRRAHELRVGLFVILGIVGFFTVLFLMTSPATFRGRYMVSTLVNNAQGIRKGDPVQMRGVNIGRVHDFELERGGVELTLEIEGEWQIPADSRSELISNGLLGGLTVAVVPGSSTEMVEPFEEIPGAVVPGIFDSAGDLTADAGVALERIQALL
ncbi:MAG: MCE family protein, partial [Gemmatimonadetes bacterium]|nr:MCE family protein [Gemmatimonadota bacterium]